MLQHGLQGMHKRPIILPSAAALRPDRDLLALRYKWFKRAS